MAQSQPPSDEAGEFEALLSYLKRSRGFDFTGYKRSSLTRRISRRMQTVDISGFDRYREYLDAHTDEFAHLFDTILINVTAFFRDRDVWEYLKATIVPLILDGKATSDPIRIWCAACASGEETYSLAMLLSEAMGMDAFRDRVKIYATDVDEDALSRARQASYSQRDIGEVPPELVEKYFEPFNTRYVFRKDLRRAIIFGRHDLMNDAPISRIDLLMCRNALMYFNSESQARILSRFHFSLLDAGYLVMGKAEMLYTYNNLFVPMDLKRRIFRKVPPAQMRDHLITMSQTEARETVDRVSKHVRLREAALDTSLEAQCVVDVHGTLVLVNERARSLLGIAAKDVSRPVGDLDFYNRITDLKGKIQEVYAEGNPAILKEFNWVTESGEVRTLEVQIAPLRDSVNGSPLGIGLAFRDLTQYKRLQEKLEETHQELETAYEELQSTNEELETTNEELQSTIEELETTNEELQATNEELETINEELQSTNEEMQTINLEFRSRTTELNHANNFLASILASMRGGVVVVDPDFRVAIWSKTTEDLWGLRSSEVEDKNFLNLDIGLPVDQLRQPIRRCLAGEVAHETLTLDAINRRGKALQCKVTCTPLLNHSTATVDGVILLMEEV